MSTRLGAVLFLMLAAVFLIVNRGAYRGYFQDDEIDNISWTGQLPITDYAKGVVTPLFEKNNFRPVGHFFFREAGAFFGLNFPRYVFAIHAIHLLNVWLLWLLARKLGAKPWVAAAACLFFALHMALFDAVWKPMYVFDLLCATFCLASILLFAGRHWIASFAAFWFAYKAKELAIMLPLVLASYEYWFGKRNWKPLIPFFVASVSFGLQGLFLNPNQNNDYTFRFGIRPLVQTGVYYAGRVLLLPYAGFLLLVAALFVARNRRTWFGLVLMVLFFAPLLFLPGRVFSPYCYLPFTGLALAFAGFAEARSPWAVAAFLLLWLPLDYTALRNQRRATLAHDDAVRVWMTTLAKYAAAQPRTEAFVCSGAPEGFARWGVSGAIRYLFPTANPEIYSVEEPAASEVFQRSTVALLTWQGNPARLDIVSHTPGTRDVAYLEMNGSTPVWQLDRGWYPLEGNYRWIEPSASAHLWQPGDARRFTLRVNVGPELLEKAGPVTVLLSLGDQVLEPRRFTQKGWQQTVWDLTPGPPGPVTIRFQVSPGYRPAGESRELGIAIGGFGFSAT